MTTDQWITAGIPVAAIVLGILRNEFAMGNLERHVVNRVDSLEKVIGAKFEAVDAKFEAARQGLLRVEGVLDARMKHLEEERK